MVYPRRAGSSFGRGSIRLSQPVSLILASPIRPSSRSFSTNFERESPRIALLARLGVLWFYRIFSQRLADSTTMASAIYDSRNFKNKFKKE